MSKKRSETQLLLLNNLIYRDEFTKEWYKGETVLGKKILHRKRV